MLDFVCAGALVVEEGRHLAGEEGAEGGGYEAEQGADVPEAVGLDDEAFFVEPAAALDGVGEGLGVSGAIVVDEAVLDGLAPEFEDLVHGGNPLGADLDTFEAVGAVPDAAGLAEGLEPFGLDAVTGVSGEAEGLGEGGGAEEALVDLEDGAIGDAGAAHDAAHDLVEGEHVCVVDDVFVVGGGSDGGEPGLYLADSFPRRALRRRRGL